MCDAISRNPKIYFFFFSHVLKSPCGLAQQLLQVLVTVVKGPLLSRQGGMNYLIEAAGRHDLNAVTTLSRVAEDPDLKTLVASELGKV